MRAVWRASRGAVKRRRVQTVVIGLVVLCSTTTVFLALALLSVASGPFERAFEQRRGAHAVASFDRTKVSDDRLAASADRPGVAAAAGPFPQAVVSLPGDWLWMAGGTLTVVGRADPGGPVDRIELLEGRWATAPGELVVEWPSRGGPGPELLGSRLDVPGAGSLKVVGFASGMSRSASAWATPAQVAALHPAATQMLYRFTDAPTEARLGERLATVVSTTGIPRDALMGVQTSFALERAYAALADSYLPFMSFFGALGLLVSVLIVGNVVSGAVLSGLRHIGVLKAMGFTPNQVVAVYLTTLSVPAVTGAVLGTLAGGLLADPVLTAAFTGIETGPAGPTGADPWVYAACLLGVPVLVLLAALVPALRAHRLPAARAIATAGAPRAGRGRRVQRFLAGSPLPRSVSMGLGRPFARPGRSLLTLSALVLGVTTVTLATGLSSTMLAFGDSGRDGGTTVEVSARGPQARALDDVRLEQRLRSLPGAASVRARAFSQAHLVGESRPVFADFYRGDGRTEPQEIARGRAPRAAGEIAAGPAFLDQRGLRLGSRITLELNGNRIPVQVVGVVVQGNARALEASWPTLERLAPALRAAEYRVRLTPGADPRAYAAAARALDDGLDARVLDTANAGTTTVVAFSTVFTVLLTAVAALGVFNTVLLDTRERRRDLAMMKSVGMTPRQVVVTTISSVAGLGLVGGLLGIPLGIAAHGLVLDHIGVIAFTERMRDVWHLPQLSGLLLAGVSIAVLGALLPARTAARSTIATALHTE
ncbi:ABC transporter permease [Streptomyces sp. NPDC097619]|uniref:ABC transporter permease n=1 Tax=Streptomyces sp. NPDC097619 TaxID=3157228 RepID=UPI00331B9B89